VALDGTDPIQVIASMGIATRHPDNRGNLVGLLV